MRTGHTAIFHSHQGWVPSIRKFHQELSRALKRHANTNTYLTGGGVEQSIAVHNDMQDTLIVQTHGAKRWRLWAVPEVMLPVSDDLIYGKVGSKVLDITALGAPYMDVTVRRGDVLYVPRGVLHATSTLLPGETADEPSLHLTVGVDVMLNVGGGQTSLDLSYFHFLGGNGRSRVARTQPSKLQEALSQLALRRLEMRKSVDLDVLHAGMQRASGGAAGKPQGGGWKERLSGLMHEVVDELIFNTSYAEDYAEAIYDEMKGHFVGSGARRR